MTPRLPTPTGDSDLSPSWKTPVEAPGLRTTEVDWAPALVEWGDQKGHVRKRGLVRSEAPATRGISVCSAKPTNRTSGDNGKYTQKSGKAQI